MTDPRPVRLCLSRAKGFSLQALSIAINGLPAVKCSRPGKWGSRWRVGDYVERFSPDVIYETFKIETAAQAVECFRREYESHLANPSAAKYVLEAFQDIRGKNLACWCKLCSRHAATGKPLDETCPDCAPCHCDPLGMLANGFTCEAIP